MGGNERCLGEERANAGEGRTQAPKFSVGPTEHSDSTLNAARGHKREGTCQEGRKWGDLIKRAFAPLCGLEKGVQGDCWFRGYAYGRPLTVIGNTDMAVMRYKDKVSDTLSFEQIGFEMPLGLPTGSDTLRCMRVWLRRHV